MHDCVAQKKMTLTKQMGWFDGPCPAYMEQTQTKVTLAIHNCPLIALHFRLRNLIFCRHLVFIVGSSCYILIFYTIMLT